MGKEDDVRSVAYMSRDVQKVFNSLQDFLLQKIHEVITVMKLMTCY